MPVDVTATLRKALRQLEEEKSALENRIAAIHMALNGVQRSTEQSDRPRRRSRRRRMSAAARKAVGQRMKAYWARRRTAATPKGKAAGKGKK
jgi:hypothetical protein